MKTTRPAQLETQRALRQIRYLLESTQPTHSEADTAIRHSLEITANSLEENSNMLNAQRVGLKALNDYLGLTQRLPPPSGLSPQEPQERG
jgi:hypothetical protein